MIGTKISIESGEQSQSFLQVSDHQELWCSSEISVSLLISGKLSGVSGLEEWGKEKFSSLEIRGLFRREKRAFWNGRTWICMGLLLGSQLMVVVSKLWFWRSERDGSGAISFMMTCGFLYLSSEKLNPGLVVWTLDIHCVIFPVRFEGICVDSKYPWIQFLLKSRPGILHRDGFFFQIIEMVEEKLGCGDQSSVVSNCMGKSLGSLFLLWTVMALPSFEWRLLLLDWDSRMEDCALKYSWMTGLSMGACSMLGTTLWICWEW